VEEANILGLKALRAKGRWREVEGRSKAEGRPREVKG
jgi:hypothetical protein